MTTTDTTQTAYLIRDCGQTVIQYTDEPLTADTIDSNDYSSGAIKLDGVLVWEEDGSETAHITTIVPGALHDYRTGDYIREATLDETIASIEASLLNGGAGVIIVDGRSCYVEGGV